MGRYNGSTTIDYNTFDEILLSVAFCWGKALFKNTNVPEKVYNVQGSTLTDSLNLGLANGNNKVFGLGLVRHFKRNAIHQLILQENHWNKEQREVKHRLEAEISCLTSHKVCRSLQEPSIWKLQEAWLLKFIHKWKIWSFFQPSQSFCYHWIP